jgi:hypothetical protein
MARSILEVKRDLFSRRLDVSDKKVREAKLRHTVHTNDGFGIAQTQR